jgi:hypothetical protein
VCKPDGAFTPLCLCVDWRLAACCRDFGVEDKLLGYVERAATSSLQGSIPGMWGKLQKLWYL